MSFKYYNTKSLGQTRAKSEAGLEEFTMQKTYGPQPSHTEKSVKLTGVLQHLPGSIPLPLRNKQGMQINNYCILR